MKARALFAMSTILAIFARNASAGPWSVEPSIGMSTDYSTNPELRSIDPVSERHVALLYDLPLRYDVDDLELALIPHGRLSNGSGYSSLASNSETVDADATLSSERGSLSLQAAAARDSSLYNSGLPAYGYGVGVRQDKLTAAVDWTRFLTVPGLTSVRPYPIRMVNPTKEIGKTGKFSR